MPEKSVWFNGQLVPAEQARVSVFDHGLLYGDGVFEGIRVYKGRVLKMLTHLRRLFEGAQSIHLAVPYSIDQIVQAIRQAVAANQVVNGYIRLCVTRGAGTLGLNPYLCKKPNVFAIVDSISLYPPEMYDQGMAIITAATIRNHPAALSAQIKSLNYLNNILAKIEAINAGVSEAIMLNHLGYVCECTADNIFAVRRLNGRHALYTPPIHAGILAGVTRRIVIELAEQAGIPVHQPDLTRHDFYTAHEVFLTGTAAEIMPVTKIDGRTIGDGRPGPVTQRLTAAFRKLIEHAPED